MAARYEVATILRRNNERLTNICSNSWQLRTLYALGKCRTAALGGHIDRCTHERCNALHLSYNSCRNRHCPKCQGHKQETWIRARESELVNTTYFHVVFTLPDTLNRLCLYESKAVYNLLFKTAWSVLKDFGVNPKFLGAQMGMIAILHTWGQNLSLHPHLHCIVPGGGITKAGNWKHADRNKKDAKYLFNVKAMSSVFRARFTAGLRTDFKLPRATYEKLFKNKWVVYCKPPFYGAPQVVEYLGRYTHKIAISNHRIKDISNGNVQFTIKEYRHGGRKSQLELTDTEFIRRFTLHILPKGFVRIRHYGILSSCKKKVLLPKITQQLGAVTFTIKKETLQLNICRVCKKGSLITVTVFDSRGPPKYWLEKLKNQSKK